MSTIPHRAKLLAVIGSPCPYCGQTMQIPDRPPSRDHIKPRSKGYALFGNLSLVCCAATPTRALYRWANGLRACHELATLAPIMWRRSLSVVQPLRAGLPGGLCRIVMAECGHQMAPN